MVWKVILSGFMSRQVTTKPPEEGFPTKYWAEHWVFEHYGSTAIESYVAGQDVGCHIVEEADISLYDVIKGNMYDDVKNCHKVLTQEERGTALRLIKNVLLRHCRGQDSQIIRAINRMSLNNLPKNIGIYRRIMTDQYVAGQEYPSEIRFIKETIRKQC